jgi:hypothetical protein
MAHIQPYPASPVGTLCPAFTSISTHVCARFPDMQLTVSSMRILVSASNPSTPRLVLGVLGRQIECLRFSAGCTFPSERHEE